MIADDIREMLHRRPFTPFRVRTSGGDAYDIQNPELVVLMKSALFVAFPDGERWAVLPLLHVSNIETLRAA